MKSCVARQIHCAECCKALKRDMAPGEIKEELVDAEIGA